MWSHSNMTKLGSGKTDQFILNLIGLQLLISFGGSKKCHTLSNWHPICTLLGSNKCGFVSVTDEARKRHDMEEALKRARFESDHLRQQLSEAHRVAMSQGCRFGQFWGDMAYFAKYTTKFPIPSYREVFRKSFRELPVGSYCS